MQAHRGVTLRLCVSTIAVGLALLPTTAWGQDSATEQASEVADIVVTAQRRDERLQSVPISVTVVSAKQLSNSGISSTQDLATVTPALTVGQQTGAFLPRVRGVGTSFGGPGIENSVATYVDGVYIAAAPASLFSLTGVERIEVLKGPQGTLFGRNATGGLVQVVTKKPSEDFAGTLSANYGNYDTVGGDLYLTGGLMPGLAADFAGRASLQGDGYGRSRFLGVDANRTNRDLAFRSQLLFTGSSTTARLAADYSEISGSPYEFTRSPFDVSLAGPDLVDASPWDTNGNVRNRQFTQSYGLALTVNHSLGFADLVSITAARKGRLTSVFDADTTPTSALSLDLVWKDRQFSQELQLVSKPGSAISWLVGAYFFDAKARLAPNTFYFGPILRIPEMPFAVLRVSNAQSTRSFAGFGQATISLTEQTRLTLGLRYTIERKRYEVAQTGDLPSGDVVPLGVRGPDDVNYKRLSWRLSVDHQFSPDIMAYASVNRGFKSGGFNPGGGLNDPPFNPERLDAYEVGIKADLLDRKLRFNPSIFYYDYSNIQVTAFSPQAIPIFLNGPKAKIYGLDLDFVAQPTRRLAIRGGLSILHDRFGDFPGAVFAYPNAPFPSVTQIVGNAKGNRIPYTADWTSTIAADYVAPTRFGSVTVSMTYNHSDGFYLQSDNLRRQKAYDLLSSTIKVENEDGSLFLSLWGRNILKEAILLQANGSALGGSAQYQAPRTYGVTIGTKF